MGTSANENRNFRQSFIDLIIEQISKYIELTDSISNKLILMSDVYFCNNKMQNFYVFFNS
jgi:hypothetical protein